MQVPTKRVVLPSEDGDLAAIVAGLHAAVGARGSTILVDENGAAIVLVGRRRFCRMAMTRAQPWSRRYRIHPLGPIRHLPLRPHLSWAVSKFFESQNARGQVRAET